MVFQSFLFVFTYLPLLLIAYLIVRKSAKLSNIVLIVGSAIFYAWNSIWWLIPLIVQATTDYVAGRKMASLSLDSKDSRKRVRWLIFSLSVNLGVLSVFKYAGWLTISLNELLAYVGIAASIPVVSFALPPGISFYTFETMSYAIDVYRKNFKAETSLLTYINFVLFFPHLVAGPILRANDLIWQLKKVRPIPTPEELRLALCQIVWGLFKKIVFADNLGDVVTYAEAAVRTSPSTSPGAGFLFAVGFALQIYCDFSAYSDIARGTAQLFGIKLPRNFLTPMFSRGPREFWQRWHITLSTWMRDYLYIPLGGNQGGYFRQTTTLVITMGLAGLWHGANIVFILWGLYHAILIIIYRLPILNRLEDRDVSLIRAVWATGIFACLNLFGWLMFRVGSGSSGDFEPLLNSIALLFNNFQAPYLINFQSSFFTRGAYLLCIYGIPVILTDWVAYRRDTEFPEVLSSLKTPSLVILLVSMWFGAVTFAKRSGYDFIYFAF